MLELLSPAGSPEAVVAAVQNGADAIYMGFESLNARQSAKNFTRSEFESALQYCRARGCKVYITLNTLVTDREMEEAVALARRADELGADAILVQDLGLVSVLKHSVPGMALHASTQMSIHNLAGVQAAAELGISRVVLARELSLDHIRQITAKSPIEVEVFAHGALCVCHSGQCYMSSLIGRRSGNRGMCAQPCRMQYSMGRRLDDHPLSLKDNCLVTHLKELEDAGVACVKIEGRMRRPEYTAIATGIYSRAIKDKKEPTPKEMEDLELAFSRQGFTDGYLRGELGPSMFGVREEVPREVSKLYAESRKLYTGAEIRRVPVSFYAVVEKGRPVRITVSDNDGNSATVYGPVPETAEGRALTGDMLEEQLYKTGGTPYACGEVISEIVPGLFLPVAAINDMRRKLLLDLTEKRKLPLPHRIHFPPPAPPATSDIFEPPKIIFQVSSGSQLTPELAVLGADYLYAPLELLAEEFGRTAAFTNVGTKLVAVMPRVIFGNEMSKTGEMLSKVRSLGVSEALVGNLGHIKAAAMSGFSLRGDFGLNVFNSYAPRVLARANFLSYTASFELRLSQIRDMAKPIGAEIIAYGRLPLMVTEHCIMKNSAGRCVCDGTNQLADKRGNVFPVVREFRCRNVILNTHKLFMADKQSDYGNIGLWGARLMFTSESPRECLEVAKSYLSKTGYRPNGLTRGLYYRGVE